MSEMEEKIKKVVREYILRMREAYETLHSIGNDQHIDCPYCGFVRAMRPHCITRQGHVWQCSWDTCRKQLPLEYSPPAQDELERFWDWERFIKETKGFLEAMENW